jgi:tetratricopeptide (TPR) repeat protein
MRLALIIAPSDLRFGDPGLRMEALAWLRGRFVGFGFQVVVVGEVHDAQADLERAVGSIHPGDTVLVHVSGLLAGRDSLAFGDGGCIPLGSLTAALARRSPLHVSCVLELAHEEPANDAPLAAEILAEVVQSLGGYPTLASVRPLGMAVDRIAFTRLALATLPGDDGSPQVEDLVARMYEAASATEASREVAQTFTLSRGAPSPAPAPRTSGWYAHGFPVIENGAPVIETMPEPVIEMMPEPAIETMPEPAIESVREDAQPIPDDAIEEVSAAPSPMSSESGPSIHSLIAEATELRNWPLAVQLRRQRLSELASPQQRSRELVGIARILQVECGDADGAIEALEMARVLSAKPLNVLLALRRGYERLGRWPQALEVTGALAALNESPVERASLHVICARIALERMLDRDRAAAWLLVALADDPSNGQAQAALTQLRSAQEQAAAPQDPVVAAAAPVAPEPPLAPVAAEPSPPSVEVPAPVTEPDAGARERAADRLFAEGDDEAALVELEAAAARDPMRASIYERAFASHRRTGRTDAALLAAFALEELEATDVDHQILIDQFRSVGPVRVRSSLDEQVWEALRAPGSDAVLTALFAAVESAAIVARVEELRDQRKLVVLDPADRMSESSTASVVRSFQWAARVLSVGCPNLYLRDDVTGGIATIPALEPSTGLGPSVLSGQSAKELAFLAGRYLTFYRPGHQVLLYYPGRDELTTLLLAAVQVAMPQAAAPSDDPAVAVLRARIARHIDADAHAALKKAVRALDARGGQAALRAWMGSVELTAGRVGLLLSGDLAAAMGVLRAESSDLANVPVETRRGDLIAFCASRTHATMRQQFAVTAPESVHPSQPPSASSLPPPPPPSSGSLEASLGPAL